MEPLTAIAATITTLICSEAAKEFGKDVLKDGAKETAKAAYAKLKTLLSAIQKKFQTEGVEGILKKAQDNPSDPKVQTKLQTELADQMESDRPFAEQLQALIAELEQTPEIKQVLLKGIRVQGNATIGDVEQISDRATGSVHQEALVDVEVGGDLHLGTVKQKS
jgi:hypothetical protein